MLAGQRANLHDTPFGVALLVKHRMPDREWNYLLRGYYKELVQFRDFNRNKYTLDGGLPV